MPGRVRAMVIQWRARAPRAPPAATRAAAASPFGSMAPTVGRCVVRIGRWTGRRREGPAEASRGRSGTGGSDIGSQRRAEAVLRALPRRACALGRAAAARDDFAAAAFFALPFERLLVRELAGEPARRVAFLRPPRTTDLRLVAARPEGPERVGL